MVAEKKFFPEIKLYTGAREGAYNLDRQWFIWYRIPGNPRKKFYGKINSYSTVEERLKAAEELKWVVLSKIDKDINLKKRIIDHTENRFYRKKKTRQGYRSKVRIFIEWHKGKKITKKSCHDFFDHLMKNVAGTTYNDYKVMLNRILTEVGYPMFLSDIQKVKAITTPYRYFQKHQIKLLSGYLSEKHPQLWLFVQFIYYCFIRPGELRWLKVGDIVFDEHQIVVRGEISKNHKTEYVSIPNAFYPKVKQLIHLSPNEYIFPNPNDSSKPVSINYFSKKHQLVLKSFAFDTSCYKLYSWKHTGAVNAAKAKVGMKALQIQLRHHSLDQVNDYLRQMGVHDHDDLKETFPGI